MKKFAPILVILGGILWGVAGLFVRFLAKFGLDSLQISSVRAITAAVIMIFVIIIKDRSLFKIKIKDLWIFISGGAISVFFTSSLYFNTISLSSLSIACILMYTAPVFVLVASFFIFGEKFTKKKCYAVFLALLGCVFVSGIMEESSTGAGIPAIISGLLSGIAYASYSIFGKLALNKKYSPLTYTLYAFIFAAVVAIFAIDFPLITETAKNNMFLIWFYPLTGFMISVLPYLFYTIGLSGMESGPASTLACTEPLVATLVGVFILAEPITFLNIVGIIMIITSIIILR